MADPNHGELHIRDEVATRHKLGLVGNDKDLSPSGGVGWCGEPIEGVQMFLDADHALTHLAYSGSMEPCHRCLLRLRELIDNELGGKLSAG